LLTTAARKLTSKLPPKKDFAMRDASAWTGDSRRRKISLITDCPACWGDAGAVIVLPKPC
jgi:hypothetical protein